MNANLTNKAADTIRVLAASMVEKAKSGHPGGAMGGADFVNVLYSQFLVTDPDDSMRPILSRPGPYVADALRGTRPYRQIYR